MSSAGEAFSCERERDAENAGASNERLQSGHNQHRRNMLPLLANKDEYNIAKIIFAHYSKVKLIVTSRKCLPFMVILCWHNFIARLSSCEVSQCFSFIFSLSLFNFRVSCYAAVSGEYYRGIFIRINWWGHFPHKCPKLPTSCTLQCHCSGGVKSAVIGERVTLRFGRTGQIKTSSATVWNDCMTSPAVWGYDMLWYRPYFSTKSALLIILFR